MLFKYVKIRAYTYNIFLLWNGVVFVVSIHMHHNYQQLDLQTLIDLLAQETEKYTKAFVIGSLKESNQHRALINALVEEINVRKSGVMHAGQGALKTSDNFPCC
jgi:hypothetical protein